MPDSKRRGRTEPSPDSAPDRKRQRVSQACEPCRAAREKCDGRTPKCSACVTQSRACSYSPNSKKRGIQTGYLRSLELALAWVLSNVPSAETSLKAALENETTRTVITGTDTANSETLHNRWRSAITCKIIENLLAGKTSVDLDLPSLYGSAHGEQDDDGASITVPTHANTARSSSQHIRDRSRTQTTQDTSAVLPPTPESSATFFGFTSPRLDHAFNAKQTLPENHWRLLEIYFVYTHSWFPIVNKENVLRVSYEYPEEGLSLSHSAERSGDHAELWSIFALASCQTSFMQSRTASNEATSQLRPNQIHLLAKSLVSADPRTLEIGHINALLILSLLEIGSRNYAFASILIGTAARAIGIEEHMSEIILPGGNSRTGNQRMSRTFFGCFILDTLISLHFRRMPSLRCDLVSKMEPIEEDGLEEYEPWKPSDDFNSQVSQKQTPRCPTLALSLFNQLVQLMSLLNNTLVHRIFRQPIPSDGVTLTTWTSKMPVQVKLQVLRMDGALTPPKLTIQILYLIAKAIYNPSYDQSDIVNEAFSLLRRHTDNICLIPPIVTLYLHTLSQLPTANGLAQEGVQEFYSHLLSIWGSQTEPSNMGIMSSFNDFQVGSSLHEHSLNTSIPNYDSLVLNQLASTDGQNQNFSDIQTSFSNPPLESTLSPPQSAPESSTYFNLPNVGNQYESNPLERYTSGNSAIDLDALFDALTSADDTERRNANPQFMQNLGFAPDTSLADFLTTDLAQMDPLFAAYNMNEPVHRTDEPGRAA